MRADVVVIGGGYTGLSAALTLAERGFDVALLEAHRVGWGASGRNGGQLGSGQRKEQPELERMLGKDKARALWEMAEAAKSTVRELIDIHKIDCDLKPGIIEANHKPRYDAETEAYVEHMARHYDYAMEFLPPAELQARVKSPKYSAGLLDPGAGHLHPLKLALGLAKAAEAAGVRIYERTEVTNVSPGSEVRVTFPDGVLWADHAILACNGYLGELAPEVAKRVMPINNFVIATEPLDEATAAGILRDDVAVVDSKFVVNYFRLSADRRLIFGGRESYGYDFPSDIKGFVRKAMVNIFPQAADIPIDYGWAGTLAITMERLPFLTRLAPNILSSSGYSGHGVALATFCGKLAGEAVAGQAERFDVFSELDVSKMPGGPRLRHPLLVAAMLWYTLRDRL